ncbi:ABC transporter ATP-binding protein [Nocardioides sp.]|uniref:ABC transporter ATP-binding protein n=1 Tax=Nocardioides sp. TaxID=35761 RepID=UPI002B271F8F|nr:ABC transporter ATP-binding protein [Nocardioides sp.]
MADPTTQASRLELRGLAARFGDVSAIESLDLTLEPGSFTALLGPSGCGKSTTLSMVAGLLAPSDGDVLLDGASLLGQPAERRPVSLVFQKPLLFPHLTIEQNVAYGLRARRAPDGSRGARGSRPGKAAVARQVAEMLERVRLGGLGSRRVGELSGGQEQRVSLARALVLRPRVLLLDEPFSQLDADLRGEMRRLVRELHDEFDLTTLFVTHDQEEAVELADRVALMLDGRLEGVAAPEAFYLDPPSLAAARFFGVTNELRGTVSAGSFRTADGALTVPTTARDGESILVVRPEALVLSATSEPHAVGGRVTTTRFAGSDVLVEAALTDGQSLRVRVPLGTRLAVGDSVCLELPPKRCTVFPQPAEEAS